jgi:hypothetical protein
MSTDGVTQFAAPAQRDRHFGVAKTAAAVAAVLILVAAVTIIASRLAHAAFSSPVEVSSAPDTITHSVSRGATHDIAIETVAKGAEGLELSARLSEDGGIIELPLEWSVLNAMGQSIYQAKTSIADPDLSPGDYLVDIKYGAVHLRQTLALPEGTRLLVSFVLDAGGVRILPRLKELGPPTVASHAMIFAVSGVNSGKLITTSDVPGEIVRIPAGEYRIESHFQNGNASATADVTVKPGVMTAVEIDHTAGLARLSFVGAPDADVLWRLADSNGNTLQPIAGLSAEVVLVPGTYTAVATIGAESLTAKFAIGAGESRDIILGN